MPVKTKFPDSFYYAVPKTGNSWSATSRGKGKLNIKKALRRSAKPWKIKDRKLFAKKKKKIIVTDFEFFNNLNPNHLYKVLKVINPLLDLVAEGFQVFFINQINNQFIELTPIFLLRIRSRLVEKHIEEGMKSICELFSICMVGNKKKIETFLKGINKNKDHYYIFDHYAALKNASVEDYSIQLSHSNIEEIDKLSEVHQLDQVNQILIKEDISLNSSFQYFKGLKKIEIAEEVNVDTIEELKNFPLESFKILNAKFLVLPRFSKTIKKLEFQQSVLLPSLLDFSKYNNLEEFTLFICQAKKIIFPLSIRKIVIEEGICESFLEVKNTNNEICNLSTLTNIEYLYVARINLLNFTPFGGSLKETKLKSLYLECLKELSSVPELPVSLQIFHAINLDILNKIPKLNHTQLKEINLEAIPVNKLPEFPSSLCKATFVMLNNLKMLPELKNTKIEHLIIEKMSISRFPDFPTTLRKFKAKELKDVKEIPQMPSGIESIVLEEIGITEIPDLDSTQLTILEIKNVDIKKIGKLPTTLKKLILNNVALDELPALEHTQLEILTITGKNFTIKIPTLPSTIKELNLPKEKVALEHTQSMREKFLLIAKEYKKIDALILSYGSLAKNLTSSDSQQSFVSSPSKSECNDGMDTETKNSPNKQYHPTFGIYRDIHKDPIAVNKYRYIIQDRVSIINNNITFSQSEQKSIKQKDIHLTDTLNDEQLNLAPNQYLVRLPQIETIHQWVALPGLNHDDKILSMAGLGLKNAEIQYIPERGQYEIKLTKNMTTPLYYIAEEHAYRDQKLQPCKPILPMKIKKDFDEFFNESTSLENKYSKFEKLKIKINDLKRLPDPDKRARQILQDKFFNNYFEFDTDKNITLNPELGNFFLQLLIERQGVCRHRANAFMVLCQYLEIPARKIKNEVHDMVEIYVNNQWNLIDLGGGRNHIVHQPPALNLKKKMYDKKEITKDQGEPHLLSDISKDFSSLISNWKKYFSPQFAFDSSECQNTAHVLDLIIKQNNISLPVLDIHQARIMYAAFVDRYQKQHKKSEQKEIFYLESTEDIENYLELLSISNHEQMDIIPGPLKKIVSEGGILIINWGYFSHDEIRSYKSILDKNPTFLKMSCKCQVINIIPETTQQCETLFSRSKKLKWPSHIPFPIDPYPIVAQEKLEEKKFSETDLYGDPDEWQNILLGEITLSDEFIPGALQNAIKSGKNGIQIYDAPLQNPNFCAFIKRLLVQREFYSNNGERIKLPSGFIVHFANPVPVKKPENLYILKNKNIDFKEEDHDIFYLNADTLPELKDRNIIQDGKSKNISGWLNLISEPRKKIIIKTDALSKEEERYFFNTISDCKALEAISYFDATEKPFEIFELTNLDVSLKANALITTEDPYFVTKILEEKSKKVHTFQIMNTTDPGEIIENINYTKENKENDQSIQFEVCRQEVADLLIAGETVILYGTLSYDLYRTLESMFGQPSKLNFSDEKMPVEVKGQLIVVTTPTPFATVLPQYTRSQQNVSRKLLKELYLHKFSEDKDYLSKIYQFYDLAEQISHGQIGMPEAPTLNELRIRHMLAALKDEKNINDNPIKSFFHHDYDKDSEAFAKLNVIAKYLFGNIESKPSYRLNKLKKCDHYSSVWSKANCFNAKALQKFSLEELMSLTTEKLDELKNNCHPQDFETNTQEKNTHRMYQYLEKYHGIVLKGPPGSGKTYLSMQYANDSKNHHIPFFGEENILNFLKSDPKEGEEAVLVIDEANLKTAGYWDFLSPIFSKEKPCKIQFQNNKYQLDSDRYKVIFTCNPESYPGRDYHALLQGLPTIYVEKWTEENLKQLVIKPFLIPHLEENKLTFAAVEQDIYLILQAYEKMQNLALPGTISLRDLMQVLRRFIYHIKNYQSTQSAYDACMTEWLDTFPDEQMKADFENFLNHLFLPSQQSTISAESFEKFLPINNKLLEEKDFYFCDKTRKMLIKINEDLDLAQQNTDKGPDGNPLVKSGILIEGKSGIGKSTSLAKLLIAKGFTETSAADLLNADVKDLSQCYFQFTVNPNDKDKDIEILQAAFDKGCKVILDELDVGTELEEALNQLLTGKSLKGTDPKIKGFYLLASQNGNHLSGTKALAKGLVNRLHVYYPDELTRFDLLQLTSHALIDCKFFDEESIQDIVDDYLFQKSLFPDEVNMRTFLEALTIIKNEFTTPFNPDMTIRTPVNENYDNYENYYSFSPSEVKEIHSAHNSETTIRTPVNENYDNYENYHSPSPSKVKEIHSAHTRYFEKDNGLFRKNLRKSQSAPALGGLKQKK